MKTNYSLHEGNETPICKTTKESKANTKIKSALSSKGKQNRTIKFRKYLGIKWNSKIKSFSNLRKPILSWWKPMMTLRSDSILQRKKEIISKSHPKEKEESWIMTTKCLLSKFRRNLKIFLKKNNSQKKSLILQRTERWKRRKISRARRKNKERRKKRNKRRRKPPMRRKRRKRKKYNHPSQNYKANNHLKYLKKTQARF